MAVGAWTAHYAVANAPYLKAPAEIARRHLLQGAELAIEVGEIGIADLVGDVRDRLAAVDEEGAGLADAQFGDIVADRQARVAAEEAVVVVGDDNLSEWNI